MVQASRELLGAGWIVLVAVNCGRRLFGGCGCPGRVGLISRCGGGFWGHLQDAQEHGRELFSASLGARSEEHTSELQSRGQLVCRLLLEKKKKAGETGHGESDEQLGPEGVVYRGHDGGHTE